MLSKHQVFVHAGDTNLRPGGLEVRLTKWLASRMPVCKESVQSCMVRRETFVWLAGLVFYKGLSPGAQENTVMLATALYLSL
jgi:hypothetical protein